MLSSFGWALTKAEQNAILLPDLKSTQEFENFLRHFCEVLVPTSVNDFSLEFVKTARQSSFISHRGQETAIFFDICQSLILKTMLSQVLSGESYVKMTYLLRECAALYVSPYENNFALLIQRARFSMEPEVFFKESSGMSGTLSSYGEALKDRATFRIIDLMILAHEVFHLLEARKGRIHKEIPVVAEACYDFALTQCCYEREPNFEQIATYNGRVELSNQQLASIKGDLINRRSHYGEQKEKILEEVRCDLFSFSAVIEFFTANSRLDFNKQWLRVLCCQLYFIVFCLVDIHFAVTRRAFLSFKFNVFHQRPGSVADIHFRKMAVIYGMYVYLNAVDTTRKWGSDRIKHFNHFLKSISTLNDAYTDVYHAPTIRKVMECFGFAEHLRSLDHIVLPAGRKFMPSPIEFFDLVTTGILCNDYRS